LKKIFGNGYGPKEIKLYKLVQAMAPEQKKAVEKYLVGRGMVRGGGVGQYGVHWRAYSYTFDQKNVWKRNAR